MLFAFRLQLLIHKYHIALSNHRPKNGTKYIMLQPPLHLGENLLDQHSERSTEAQRIMTFVTTLR